MCVRKSLHPSSSTQARQQRDTERLAALRQAAKRPAASVKTEDEEATKRIKVEVKAEEVDGKMVYEIEDDD